MDYSDYKELHVRRVEPGILEIVMGEEGGKLSITTARMHGEMARIWLDIDRDPETRVAILRGAGKGFSAGGDLAMVEEMTRDFAVRARVWREAKDLVYNLINCSKLVVSAMHGPAVGAGLVCGLLADISIAAKNARIIDGHTRLGVAAGANPHTFSGLAGVGDLIATCMSPLSRNRRAGELLGSGLPWSEVAPRLSGIAEGVSTVGGALALATEHGVELPIAEQVSAVVHDGRAPMEAVAALMGREQKDELAGLPR